jgi:hypothetical protein
VEASIGAFRDDKEIMAAIVFGAQGQMSQGAVENSSLIR